MDTTLFKGIGEASLSTETIKLQRDVTIVKTLESHFEQIVTAINNSDYKSKKKLTSDETRTIKIALAKIDVAVKKRFGIAVRTVYSKFNLLGIQTTPPKTNNILAGDVRSNYDTISEQLKMIQSGDTPLDGKDIDAATDSWVSVLTAFKQSVDAMDHKLGTEGVTVDLTDAKIYGYPEKAIAVVLINPAELASTYGLHADEITAAYIHEIGHAFTHIEYSHRTVKQTSMLIESIVNEVNSGKSTVDAIKLSYGKVFNDDKLDNSKTVVSAVVGLSGKYISDLPSMGGNTYSSKDSERLADQFAARFGVGKELGTGLAKLYAVDKTVLSDEVSNIGITLMAGWVISVIVAMLLPALGLFSMILLGIITAELTAMAIVGFVVYVLYNTIVALFNGGIDTGFPYDSPKRRLLRIKNDVVRQIRSYDVDKVTMSGMIASVDTLLLAADGLSDYNENLIHRVIGSFFSYSTEQNEMRDIDNMVDDLSNNDLHVMSAKIKS